MSHQQWEAIERTLAGLSAQDKRELVDRILQSLQAESPAPDRALRQRDALARLCQKLDVMPAATPSDGLTNRDHDRILYTRWAASSSIPARGSPGSSPPIPIIPPPRGGSTATRRR